MSTKPLVHLVFMDFHMPEMDGYETTRRILQHVPGISIMGLTTSVSPIDHKHALESGMCRIYTKPITSETLAHILTTVEKDLSK